MTTRREHPTHSTGAPPAQPASGPTLCERDEPYLDGLFTYCLSVMCEHEAALAALGEALAAAERQRGRGRAPEDKGATRAWLYALARWSCLRRLAEQRDREREAKDRAAKERSAREKVTAGVGAGAGAGAGSGAGAGIDVGAASVPGWARAPGARSGSGPSLSDAARTQRRRELAALAWPEAAGIAPEQREALELSVRHGLAAHEVGAVLSLGTEAASALLSNAACEVERTRAALAVVESGGCPAVARLAGDDRLLMGTALRRELVKHVDECAECRRGAERAMAGVSWPGTAPATGALTVLEAPRPAILAAVAVVRRARASHMPRFDKAGFPLDLKVRAARRERLRSKAVTTTVVATVMAAPLLALWAAYRGAPVTGEREADSSVSASESGPDRLDGLPYENAGRADDPAKSKKHGARSRSGVAVGVHVPGGRHGKGAGRLKVEAEPLGHGSLITLTATGRSPVRWSAAADAPWLTLSRTEGVLRPGESAAIRVAVDRSREPAYAWEAHVRVDPARAVVTLEGPGVGASPSRPGGGGGSPGGERPTHGPAPSRPPSSSNPPSPTDPPSSSSPDPTPTSPEPTPTDSTTPSPTPTASEPVPSSSR